MRGVQCSPAVQISTLMYSPGADPEGTQSISWKLLFGGVSNLSDEVLTIQMPTILMFTTHHKP